MKRLLRDGGVAFGCSLNEARDPGTVRAMAAAGADLVFIDLEHNPHSIETAIDLVAHAHGAGVTPLVRPPQVDYAWITRLLDGGCHSLLIPHLRRPDEVRYLLELARYYPEGRRGLATYGGAGVDYQRVTDVGQILSWGNEQLLIGLVIETPEAVDAAEEMLMPGIDFAVIGWGDLAQLYGLRGDTADTRIFAAARRVQALCRDRDIVYGVFEPDVRKIPTVLADGARLLVSGGVFQFIRAGVTAIASEVDRYRATYAIEDVR